MFQGKILFLMFSTDGKIMKKHIYVDNAATTALDHEAFEAMIPWLTENYGNASQLYSLARAPKKALQDAREIIASCINASPDEVFFTSGGTESDNWAIKGAAYASPQKKQVITSSIEHHAVLNSCEALVTQGYLVKKLDVTTSGEVKIDLLDSFLSETPTSLVSIMTANNEIGTIQGCINPDTAKRIHRVGSLFHTDAVQAVGHIPVDVKSMGVDLLSASAHKFHGPKGIGFLFVKKGSILQSFMNGGAQERRMRAGTENVASIVGMSIALKNCCESFETTNSHLNALKDRLLSLLEYSNIKYRVNGTNPLPGLVSISFPGFDGESILHRMDLMGICVSTGSACNSSSTEISHVLKAISLDEDSAKGTIRISFGRDNSMNDVDEIYASLAKILL